MTTLSMTHHQLNAARHCLIAQRLIAYAQPFVQVLSLDESMTENPRAKQKTKPGPNPKQKLKATASPAGQENSTALIKKLRAQLRNPQ